MRRGLNTDYTDSFSGDTDIFVKAWCVGGLNTDFTDYTDSFSGDTDIFVKAWCVGGLNTDFTDYTDSFYWGTLRMDLWSHCEEAQNYP